MEKRLLVFGDRNWDEPGKVHDEIEKRNPDVVISGEASGADTHAKTTAIVFHILYLGFSADWEKYGRSAGPIRNQQMINEGKPTEAVGFHHNIDRSKGSKDMYERCLKAGIPVEIIN